MEVRADDAVPHGSARKRRSAERSARRHAVRRQRIRATAHALLYLIRLRRRALLRRVNVDSEVVAADTGGHERAIGLVQANEIVGTPAWPSLPSPALKRGRDGSDSDGSSSTRPGDSLPSYPPLGRRSLKTEMLSLGSLGPYRPPAKRGGPWRDGRRLGILLR